MAHSDKTSNIYHRGEGVVNNEKNDYISKSPNLFEDQLLKTMSTALCYESYLKQKYLKQCGNTK